MHIGCTDNKDTVEDDENKNEATRDGDEMAFSLGVAPLASSW